MLGYILVDTIKVLASCLETATRLCDPKSIARVGWMLQEKGALLIVKTLLLPRERALNPKPKERDRERERALVKVSRDGRQGQRISGPFACRGVKLEP